MCCDYKIRRKENDNWHKITDYLDISSFGVFLKNWTYFMCISCGLILCISIGLNLWFMYNIRWVIFIFVFVQLTSGTYMKIKISNGDFVHLLFRESFIVCNSRHASHTSCHAYLTRAQNSQTKIDLFTRLTING